MVQIWGIVNLTEDSFSDGGYFLDPDRAIAQGEALLAAGADGLDLGAESSNPLGQRVDAAAEIARLTPVVRHFQGCGVQISIDTYKPEVMAAMLALGVHLINDITALSDPRSVAVLKDATVPIVLMFARNRSPRAEIRVQPYHDLLPELLGFFSERIATLGAAGIGRERLILDPGMGYFLGSTPQPSLWVLKHLAELGRLGLPLYVCTSRKSFIGQLIDQPPQGRSMGTLATELWALHHGVSHIRTHGVQALVQAKTLWQAIQNVV